MNSIHQSASSLSQAQLLTLLSALTVITLRQTILKIAITAGVTMIIILVLTGTVTVIQEFR